MSSCRSFPCSETAVALRRCPDYDGKLLAAAVDAFCTMLLGPAPGCRRVLLKPNLVSGRGHDGLACTDPRLVAAVARWFVDRGCQVAIGDSPAFGPARRVMAECGYGPALAGLPVRLVDFSRGVPIRLAHGETVAVAEEALACDLLVNLPKVKAHGQMLISLAVKNLFGVVVGWRKALLHARLGEVGHRFEAMIVDLAAVLPPVVSLVDGIEAMAQTGPVRGRPYRLGLVAGGLSPVAVDTALLAVLGVRPEQSPLWRECRRRGLPGWRLAEISYPFATAEELAVADFELPQALQPVSFHPLRLLRGSVKRLAAHLGL